MNRLTCRLLLNKSSDKDDNKYPACSCWVSYHIICNYLHQKSTDRFMRIKIFISVLWSLHNMPHAWEAYGQEKKFYQYRPLLVKQLQHLLYWLLCKKRLLVNTHIMYYWYAYARLVRVGVWFFFSSFTFICCRPKIETM